LLTPAASGCRASSSNTNCFATADSPDCWRCLAIFCRRRLPSPIPIRSRASRRSWQFVVPPSGGFAEQPPEGGTTNGKYLPPRFWTQYCDRIWQPQPVLAPCNATTVPTMPQSAVRCFFVMTYEMSDLRSRFLSPCAHPSRMSFWQGPAAIPLASAICYNSLWRMAMSPRVLESRELLFWFHRVA
jgi:hypothetical protein